MVRVGIALSLVFCFVCPAAMQTTGVSGSIVDETGAALPGATVQLVGAGGTNATTTGPGGQYSFTNVSPGTYRIEIRLAGFAPATRSGVVVATGDVTVPAAVR